MSPDPGFAYGVHLQAIGPYGLLGPWSARVGFLRLSPTDVKSEAGDAAFVWTVARADVCPGRWPSNGRLSLTGCALFEGGTLAVSGSQTVRPESHTAAWWAWGALTQGEWQPYERLSIRLQAGAHVPLRHHRFYFEPTPVVFEVPALSGFGFLSVSGRFL